LLLENNSTFRSSRFPIQSKVPRRLLAMMSKFSSNVRRSNAVGIVPSRRLYEPEKLLSVVNKRPMHSGMLPVNRFSVTSKDAIAGKPSQSPSGILPVISLDRTEKLIRLLRLPMQDGSVPLSAIRMRCSIWRSAKSQMPEGILPVNLLPPSGDPRVTVTNLFRTNARIS
jgi:hypothetical protein